MNYCKRCNEPLSNDVFFCHKCGCKVDETYNQPKHTNSNIPSQKKTNVCSILAVIFGGIGIIPFFNFLFLPVALILAIIGAIINKSKEKGIVIASLIIISVSLVFSAVWLLSISPENRQNQALNTSVNTSGDIQDVTPHVHKIEVIPAINPTCTAVGLTEGEKCSICNEIIEKQETIPAIEHSWIYNTCEKCGLTKDLDFDVKDNDILTIEQINFDINYVGGVDTEIEFTNCTNKQIAYIYFTIKYYDRMGHPAYCSIRNENNMRLKMTGPINAGESCSGNWNAVIYNSTTAVAQPLKIEIEFTDGTSVPINCTGRYWHSDSYYGGDLHAY